MTYLETIAKLQAQSLDSLKQAQATQVATLTTIGEIVSNVPSFQPSAPFGQMPTIAEITELNTAFLKNVLEQQSAFASQLAGVFTVTQKNVVNAAERVIQTASNAATATAK